jgi:hypothetical protein
LRHEHSREKIDRNKLKDFDVYYYYLILAKFCCHKCKRCALNTKVEIFQIKNIIFWVFKKTFCSISKLNFTKYFALNPNLKQLTLNFCLFSKFFVHFYCEYSAGIRFRNWLCLTEFDCCGFLDTEEADALARVGSSSAFVDPEPCLPLAPSSVKRRERK